MAGFVARARLMAVAALLVVPHPASAEHRADRGSLDRLMQTSRDWSKASATGNIDKITAFWANDAIVIMPGQPEIRGKKAIREFVRQSLKVPGFRISWKPVEGYVSGDLGYLIERTSISTSDAKGAVHTDQLRAVTIWRKQANGAWKNEVDFSTPAP